MASALYWWTAYLAWMTLFWLVQHPVLSLLAAGVLLYGFRSDLSELRRRALGPTVRLLGSSGKISWRKAQLQGSVAVHRWHEITLFSRYDAPSRLVFGLLGIAIVFLSLKLSYQGLIPVLNDTAKGVSSLSRHDVLDVLFVHSGRHAFTIVLFEAAVGFIALEFFGVTKVLRFAKRYPSERLRRRSGFFLLFVLLGFGMLEAWLSLEANEWRFDTACAQIDYGNPICAKGVAPYSWFFGNSQLQPQSSKRAAAPQAVSTPERPKGSGAGTKASGPRNNDSQLKKRQQPSEGAPAQKGGPPDNNDPQLRRRMKTAAINRAITIVHTKAWLDMVFALVMPFALMVVGLAFDFFEEMYLPVASFSFSVFHAALSASAWLLAASMVFFAWLFALAAKILALPAALAAAVASMVWDLFDR